MDPECQTCGHTRSHHGYDGINAEPNDERCRVSRAMWDDGRWRPLDRCSCIVYVSPRDLLTEWCPHEFVRGSLVCVICTRSVPRHVQPRQ